MATEFLLRDNYEYYCHGDDKHCVSRTQLLSAPGIRSQSQPFNYLIWG